MSAAGNRAAGKRAAGNRAVVRVSVRAVVETTMHESDLAAGAETIRRMQEGAAAHRARQTAGGELERA